MCHTSYEMFVLLFLTSGGQVICTLVPNIWGYVCYVWTRHFSLEIIAVDEGTVLLQSRPLSWAEDYTGMLAADIRKWFRIIWAQSLNAQNFIILFTTFQSQRAFFGQHNTNTSGLVCQKVVTVVLLPELVLSTSAIIFLSSKWVLAWPSFSIILFNSIMSKI